MDLLLFILINDAFVSLLACLYHGTPRQWPNQIVATVQRWKPFYLWYFLTCIQSFYISVYRKKKSNKATGSLTLSNICLWIHLTVNSKNDQVQEKPNHAQNSSQSYLFMWLKSNWMHTKGITITCLLNRWERQKDKRTTRWVQKKTRTWCPSLLINRNVTDTIKMQTSLAGQWKTREIEMWDLKLKTITPPPTISSVK